jgi:FixJ family two-component response regulator
MTRATPSTDPGTAPLICVIDDDSSVRDALSSLFRSIGLRVKLYGSAAEFFESVLPAEAGCLVLDIRMPGLSGLDFQDRLVKANISLPIIFMTGHGDIPMSVRAMKAGAVDFLPKPFRDQDMIDAVSSAIEHDRQRRVAEGEVARIRGHFGTLSPREQQVMMLVTAGKKNKQVAGDLGLSEITVKVHRGNAMRKMCARTLADLVHMADAADLRVT